MRFCSFDCCVAPLVFRAPRVVSGRAACGPTGVPGAARSVLWAGLLGVPVGGGPPDLRRCYAPPDLRPPRGLPARSPSTMHNLPGSVWSLCVPVGGSPPARSPHASLAARSGRSRSPARPRHRPPAPRPDPAGHAAASHRSGLVVCVLPALVLPSPIGTATRPHTQPSRITFLHRHPISHAIPPRLFQTLNPQRWNCNVSRRC